MTFFNVLYFDLTEDADIICVPDRIAEKINTVRREFLDWLPHADENDNMYWAVVDGQKCSVCETDGFVKWLNEHYCANGSKAYIVRQHVQVDNRYDTIEF